MFTGLIADVGRVSAFELDDTGARLTIDTGLAGGLSRGDSIAVNGVCLTATEAGSERFSAIVIGQTLRRSALGRIEVGDRVNLECALRAADPLGGHIVQGHVDGVGIVREVREDAASRVLDVETGEELTRYMVARGSIALDGVSLTVSALLDDGLEVSLIPETLSATTLGHLAAGAPVNVEVDILAKHVERLLGVRA
jgi:riboflavin synthase